MREPETRDIPAGESVWTADKAAIGTIADCWQSRPALGPGQLKDVGFLSVDRGAQSTDRWLFVPLAAVHYVHPDGVYLDVRADDLDRQGWAVRHWTVGGGP